jgi:hypothetical protein
MSAKELPVTSTKTQLKQAAAARGRVRVRGRVTARGDAWNGRYRQTWLRIDTTAGGVRVTASPTSPLGTLPIGSPVDLAARLTGLVDLVTMTYFAERAQLIQARP